MGQQGRWDPSKLVFLDESAAKTNMTRLRGRSPRGERLLSNSSQGHGHTTTMISSIRLDGFSTCMTIDGATDAEVFHAYVRQILCSTLHAGDIVIMDNLSSHKNKQTLIPSR